MLNIRFSSADRELSVNTVNRCLALTVRRDVQENDEEAVRVKEQSILELGTLLAKTGQAAGTCCFSLWQAVIDEMLFAAAVSHLFTPSHVHSVICQSCIVFSLSP